MTDIASLRNAANDDYPACAVIALPVYYCNGATRYMRSRVDNAVKRGRPIAWVSTWEDAAEWLDKEAKRRRAVSKKKQAATWCERGWAHFTATMAKLAQAQRYGWRIPG